MGYWDPVFIRPLALKRPVIMFDPPAVGQTTGDTQRTPIDSMCSSTLIINEAVS